MARFAAQRFRFPGVDIKARLFRNYPWGELASHVIGYIGRINQAEKKAMEDWPEEDQANYRGTEYIGKLGVEQSYEKQLHGITGVEQVETSAGGRAVRKLASSPATPGNTVMLSIDIKLQKLVEDMYGDRRGALVALDPKTGEVLAFVSKPTFDPNLFVDGIDSENWQALNESIDKPLLNRALRGTYPPGSTYKPFMALAALETGKRTAQRRSINDPGSWTFGGHVFRSHGDHGLGAVDMHTQHRQVEQHLLLLAGQRHGRGPDARLHEAAGLRPDHRHRHQRRGARRAAQPGVEAQLPTSGPSRRSGTPARPSRWASARATTASPCCSWRRPRPRWPTTASSTSRTW